MLYILDTNIIISSLMNDAFEQFYNETYRANLDNEFVLSVVVEGESKSIASKRKWGNRRTTQLEQTLAKYIIYPIKLEEIINAYVEIDTYSQGLLTSKPLPKGMTARNIGKNDLWIAATAYTLGATLVTTDKDFDHLDQVYFQRDYINIEAFR